MRGLGGVLKTLKVPHYAKFTPSTLIYAYGLRVNSSKYEKRCAFYFTPFGNAFGGRGEKKTAVLTGSCKQRATLAERANTTRSSRC